MIFSVVLVNNQAISIMAEKLYIASCSFGKDSIATILLALEHNEPLDRVVFAEVMFDHHRGISGEIPEHISWIYSTAIPKFESMGVKVDVVRARRDYIYFFVNAVRGGYIRARYTVSLLAANVSSTEIARLPLFDATWPSLRAAIGRLANESCSTLALPPMSGNANTG